ncbi:hypothetical protein FACS189494_04190 [Spirochaetia bacterium]|nr:hypothetical protein FACS189494_04190 [Spirochaetia bacterium]
MQYKQKLYILSGICSALFIALVLTFVLDPEKSAARSAAWTPFNSKNTEKVEQIELNGNETVNLHKVNDKWFVNFEDADYPARKEKIDDLFAGLTKSGAYAVRSKSESSHDKLGLGTDSAERIIFRGANNTVLFDLFVGNMDTSGKEIYVRRAGESEVRSGADIWTPYLNGARTSWYELNFFPNHDKSGLTVENVQRLLVYPPIQEPDEAGNTTAKKENFVLARADGGWQIEGVSAIKVDTPKADSYVRFILDSSGDDFISALKVTDPPFNTEGTGRLVIEFGDGTRKTITLGEKFNEKNTAVISGVPYVFSLADWTVNRIWQDYNELEQK